LVHVGQIVDAELTVPSVQWNSQVPIYNKKQSSAKTQV